MKGSPYINKTVIFVHIPKTGGTTLYHIIDQNYQRGSIYTLWKDGSIEDFKGLSDARKGEIRMLRGHQGYGLHRFLPQPSVYITVLREPIERVISYYHFIFIRRTPHHYCHNLVVSNDMSLKEFIESEADAMVDNAQTRLLSGMMETGHEFGFGKCPREALEAAKRNLRENFVVVGLTEEFDKTLILLKRALGWRKLFYARQNISFNRPRKEDLPQETLEAIIQANELDIELYRYARELFEERVRKEGPSFAEEVARFQRLNRQLSPFTHIYWELRKRWLSVIP
ncbi:MAG TPA: hypothetical protein ENG33_03685 [Chloroflexi bacterium]|nr:hypothetical protein [Chloroflexota bacterium]